MKILVVSQYYAPEPFRVTDVCRDLVERGHEVTVLCGIPNYPSGRFYPGYSLFKRRREMLDGVRVERAWLIPRGKGGALGLSANYLSFLFSTWFRHFRLARRGFDVVFCYEVSPLTMAIPAVAVARRARIPLTLYLTDLWPENVEAVNGIRNPRILAAIGRMAAWIYRRCDRVLVPSRSFVPRVTDRGMPRTRVEYWPQYAEDYYTTVKPVDEADTTTTEPTRSVSQTPEPMSQMLDRIERCAFPVVFTGNIGTAQGLDVLIEAARLLPPTLDTVFFLVGDGRAREALEARVREAGSPIADRIVFCGRVPGEQVPSFLSRAGAALMTLAPDPVFSLYLPTKLQVYLASGVPILSVADGAAADIVREAQAGIAVPSGDAAALAQAVEQLAAMTPEQRAAIGRRGRAFFEQAFSKTALMDQFEDWLAHPAAMCEQETPMAEWTPEQLQRLQQTEMEMLALLDRICTEHGIRYYLAAGTCLGAMRHAGMIPWDDDIDVYLHREEYEKLAKILPGALPSGYFYQSADTDPAYLYPFAKIRKDGTAFVQEALRDLPMHHGIYIDLFPVDGAPKNAILRQWQRVKMFFLKRVSIGHILPRKAERVAYGLLYKLAPRDKWQKLYDRYCQRYDSRKTGYSLCAASDYAYRRELVPREVYGEGKRVPFGELLLPVPDDAETYLTTMYGEWRTPPPPEARLSQHAPWRISFDEEYHP